MPDILDQVVKFSKLTFKTAKRATRELAKSASKLGRARSRRGAQYRPAHPPPLTAMLPLQWPIRKMKSPWYVTWVKNEQRFSQYEEGIIRVELVKGCHGLMSGAAFRANPNMMLPADAATLSYSIYFPAEFNFVKGGKLPGVNIGSDPNDCSTGGCWSETGGSFRVMFRENGSAIGYAYMPLPGAGQGSFDAQNDEFKAVAKVKGSAGIDLWHRSGSDLQLQAGAWNKISISIKLNTPGQYDGAAAVTVNGRTKNIDGLLWRLNAVSKVNAVNFVTFFGGGTDEWNSPVDTYVLYKDVAFAAN